MVDASDEFDPQKKKEGGERRSAARKEGLKTAVKKERNRLITTPLW